MDAGARGRHLVRPILSGLLELAGFSAITYGCFLLTPVLGWIVAGLFLVLVSIAIDPPQRKPKEVPAE